MLTLRFGIAWRLAISLLPIVALANSPVSGQVLPLTVQKALDSARHAQQQSDWKEADTQFSAALKLAPESADILLALAETDEQWAGHELRAVSWFHAYLALTSRANEAQIAPRIAALEQRSRSNAISLIQRAAAAAINLAPKDRILTLSRIAAQQVKAGDVVAAMSSLSTAANIDVDKYQLRNAYTTVASTCASRGDLDCVENLLRRAIDNDTRVGLLNAAAFALAAAKHFPEALRYAERLSGVLAASSYLAIAQRQDSANEQDGAKQSVSDAILALRAASSTDFFYNMESLINLATALGEINNTRISVAALPQSTVRIGAFSWLAVAYANEGDASSARQALQNGVDTYYALARNQNYATSYYASSSLITLIKTAMAINATDFGNRLFATYQTTIRGNDGWAQSRRFDGFVAVGRYSEAQVVANNHPDLQQRKWLSESLDRLRSEHAQLLTKAGRLDDAEAVGRTISDPDTARSLRYAISNLITARVARLIHRDNLDIALDLTAKDPDENSRRSQIQRILKIYNDRIAKLIKSGDFPTVEVALSSEPRPGVYAATRIELAKVYAERGDTPAFHHALENAAVSVAHSSLQLYGRSDYTNLCTDLAKLYIQAVDLDAATRLIDAAFRTLIALSDNGKSASLESLVIVRADIGKAALNDNNMPVANAALTQAVSDANQIPEVDERANALAYIAELLAQTGSARELMEAVKPLPPSYSKDRALSVIAVALFAQSQSTDAISLIASIQDTSQRSSALMRALTFAVAKSDWSGAMNLADDSVLGATVAANLASKLLSAGDFDRAASLETRFADKPDLHDSYLGTLAQARSLNGEFDVALKTALRQSSIARRTQTLFSLVSSVMAVGGVEAAKPFYAAAMAQLSAPMDADSRLELCTSTRSFLAYGAITQIDLPGPELAPACLTEAFSRANLEDRVRAFDALLSAPYLVTQPMPGSVLVPGRPVIGRWIMESQQSDNESTRAAQTSDAASVLARDGAIDMASLVLNTVRGRNYSSQLYAIRWLVDANALPEARELVRKAVEEIEARTDDGSRNDGFLTLVTMMIAMGDFKQALNFADRINPPSSRIGPYSEISRAAANSGRYDLALQAIVTAHRIAGLNSGYWSSTFVSIAAEAGDKNIEDWLNAAAAYQTDTSAQDIYFTRGAVISALLRWKQIERAKHLITTQEEALKNFDPSRRPAAADLLALHYAWAGNIAGLGRLILETRLPRFQMSLLMSAAAGFAKAGKIDVARTTLQRAVSALEINRPDAQAWVNYQITLALEDIDPPQAEKQALDIADLTWRARAVANLVQSRIGKSNLSGAAALLRAGPSSAATDPFIPRLTRFLVGKNDLDGAHALISKAIHPVIRDEARRQMGLALTHLGKAQDAFTETNAIESPLNRAYALADVGMTLAARAAGGQLDLGYFAQLCLFSAAKLADTLQDPIQKSDVLIYVAHAQALLKPNNSAATRQRAIAVAATIGDDNARTAAEYWAKELTSAPNIDNTAAAEREDWIYQANYGLTSTVFSDIDLFTRTTSLKPTSDVVDGFLNGANDLLSMIETIHNKAAQWTDKRAGSLH